MGDVMKYDTVYISYRDTIRPEFEFVANIDERGVSLMTFDSAKKEGYCHLLRAIPGNENKEIYWLNEKNGFFAFQDMVDKIAGRWPETSNRQISKDYIDRANIYLSIVEDRARRNDQKGRPA
jgi:hypothetical protein